METTVSDHFPILPSTAEDPVDALSHTPPASSWDQEASPSFRSLRERTTPVHVSSSRDLLTRSQRRQARVAAEWGWQAAVRRLSGGVVKPRPGRAERAHRAGLTELRRAYSRPQTVMVANPKGGAGKTPTAWLLAATFGQSRGGYVLAWDDNETRGTLGVRSEGWDAITTVWDLLEDVDRFETTAASVGDLGRYIRPQEARFDVLASDDDAARMAQIGEMEFDRLQRVLTRFYRLLVVDTGNNLRAANWQAAVNTADLLVVPSTYELDAAYSAAWMLDHLCTAGREDLVAGAVTVLSPASPQIDKDVRAELIKHFSRTAAVVEVPYDPGLVGGGPIDYRALSEASRRAWVRVASVVSAGLGAADQRQPSGRGLR
jgi:MinD-like ATPase involved in chromosome partitioning or flagellar assembly